MWNLSTSMVFELILLWWFLYSSVLPYYLYDFYGCTANYIKFTPTLQCCGVCFFMLASSSSSCLLFWALAKHQIVGLYLLSWSCHLLLLLRGFNVSYLYLFLFTPFEKDLLVAFMEFNTLFITLVSWVVWQTSYLLIFPCTIYCL